MNYYYKLSNYVVMWYWKFINLEKINWIWMKTDLLLAGVIKYDVMSLPLLLCLLSLFKNWNYDILMLSVIKKFNCYWSNGCFLLVNALVMKVHKYMGFRSHPLYFLHHVVISKINSMMLEFELAFRNIKFSDNSEIKRKLIVR